MIETVELKYTQIDPKQASEKEIKAEIERLQTQHTIRMNGEQAVKILINSMYGAIANPYFVFYNTAVAESITLQGQDLIKYAEKIINYYFSKMWVNDKTMHELLGVKVDYAIDEDVALYMDTDSCYVNFYPIIKGCGYEGDGKEFILTLYRNRLKEYLNKCFEIYAKKYNTDNIQEFELEMIAHNGIWLAKKKYILNPIWKDGPNGGIHIDSLSKIKSTGVEIVQSSTPLFARDKLKTFIHFIFKAGVDFRLSDLVALVKTAKEEFKLQDIGNISINKGISEYDKFVFNDISTLHLKKGCPIHVRAAAIHNNLLNSRNLKGKYELIKSGDKIKYYYANTLHEDTNIFGFGSNQFPYEIAPPVDYEVQFEKVMLEPLNRILEAMGFVPLSPNLIVERKLW